MLRHAYVGTTALLVTGLMITATLVNNDDPRADLMHLLTELDAAAPQAGATGPTGHHRITPWRASDADRFDAYELAFTAQRYLPRFAHDAPRPPKLRTDLEPCFRWLRIGARTTNPQSPVRVHPPTPPHSTGELTRQLNERVITEIQARVREWRYHAAVDLWLAGGQMLLDYHDTFWLEQRLLPCWTEHRLSALPQRALAELHHGLARLDSTLRVHRPFEPWLARHVRELLDHSDERFETARRRSRTLWQRSPWPSHWGAAARLVDHSKGLLELARLAPHLRIPEQPDTSSTYDDEATMPSRQTIDEAQAKRWQRFTSAPRHHVQSSSVADHADKWFRMVERQRQATLLQLRRLRRAVAHRLGRAQMQHAAPAPRVGLEPERGVHR